MTNTPPPSLLITVRARTDEDFPGLVFSTLSLHELSDVAGPAEQLTTADLHEAAATVEMWLRQLVDKKPA